ncbi:nucleotidyltransferase substrate binding protein [Rickettsia endosymbiont of Pantilius tunicatus]|uniref:nucleotidyltransferase substrate binding protein n=1 Tax=Rickettsia endosymbiont of Pantilius tunicatus TaxID=3066267 RepID=UPI0030E5B2FE
MKTKKRFCKKAGKSPYTLREIVREAAVAGLISDPTRWFKFIEIRNITVHTYNEKNLELVINNFDNFSNALSELINNLEKYSDSD